MGVGMSLAVALLKYAAGLKRVQVLRLLTLLQPDVPPSSHFMPAVRAKAPSALSPGLGPA